jgi:hypothetical protein
VVTFSKSSGKLPLSNLPNSVTIYCENFYQGDGVLVSNTDRSINRSFNGAQFQGNNTNIQSDNNTNIVNLGEKLPKDVFEKLRSEIQEIVQDPVEREQALEFAQNLQDAVEQGDAQNADKYGKWLDRIISGSASLATIAQAVQAYL